MVTQVLTRKIDADTHFNLTVDYKALKDMLPRSKVAEADDMMWRDGERFANPQGVAMELTGRPGGFGGGGRRGDGPDASVDAEFRLQEMDRLGFDMQVLNTQRALPSPLRAADRPLWLRVPLAQLYNNAAAELQNKYPDRFITQITVPWDSIEESVKELERGKAMGLRAVTICGSWLDKNLDAYELYPFWEACNDLDIVCMVHNNTQPCGGTILDHTTSYPMVGTERYHRLHIGTYVGFGLDYTVACAALTLGGVLDEFPNLRFLFFEAGASWMSYAMMGCDRSFYIERACSRTNTPPSELIKQHCMTAIESLEPVDQMVDAYGSDNFVIGTDFPHPEFQRLPNATTDITDRPGLTEEDKRKILGANLARAFKL